MRRCLRAWADAVTVFFGQLEQSGHARRVLLMTFSEFGRRVQENGSRGTDHGAASCLFVAGPAVRGGLVGRHPSLAPDQLDAGDLRHHTDFRRVYATLLGRLARLPRRGGPRRQVRAAADFEEGLIARLRCRGRLQGR